MTDPGKDLNHRKYLAGKQIRLKSQFWDIYLIKTICFIDVDVKQKNIYTFNLRRIIKFEY